MDAPGNPLPFRPSGHACGEGAVFAGAVEDHPPTRAGASCHLEPDELSVRFSRGRHCREGGVFLQHRLEELPRFGESQPWEVVGQVRREGGTHRDGGDPGAASRAGCGVLSEPAEASGQKTVWLVLELPREEHARAVVR